MERWLVWSVLLKFVLFVNVNAWQWQLILKHDVPSGWNLDGAFSYYDWGEQLARLKPDLPPDFDYESFRRAQGLWVVLPAASKNESIATFGLNFRGKGTAFHNVNLTYSIGGNAKVYLMDGGNDTEPVYEIQPPSEQKFQLETVTIPITNLIPWFIIKAVVHDRPSYIIIERIVACFEDVAMPRTSPKLLQTPVKSKSVLH